MKKTNDFFTDDEKRRIQAAVREAEARTSGEIVPMVVDQSYDYPRAEILGGGLFALGAALFLTWLWGHSSVWVFLPLFLALYFPFKLLIRNAPDLKRRLIHPAEIDAEVEEKAMIAFLEHGLHHTRDETGILILISLLEHRVRVLADRGISAKVPAEAWNEIVRTVTDGIKSGATADALCTAIKRCGDLLQQNFPLRKDDANELPDLIVG